MRKLKALLGGQALDRELTDEMRHHIDLETEDLMRTKGLPREEARRIALARFGGIENFKEAHRDARGVRWIPELLQDIRYAIRGLARSPGYTVSALLLLGLGIGSSTAVFSAVDAVLLSKLPYPRDEELVRVYQQNSPTNIWSLSVVDIQAILANQRPFSAAGAMRPRGYAISVGGQVEQMTVVTATRGLFDALEVHPAFGRAFSREDEQQGAPATTLVTDAYAVQHFGQAPVAVGKTLTLDGVPHTIIGVLPKGVQGLVGWNVPVWPVVQLSTPTRRGPFGWRVVGRLSPGVSLEAAKRELAGLSARIFPTWSAGFQDTTAMLTPYSLRETILGDAPRTLWMFAAAVGLVLLIAVANVASLTLVRATGRWREVTLRTVLGASRARLGRMLVTESLVLAIAGAALGVLAGLGGLSVLRIVGTGIPRLGEASLDIRTIGFAVLTALGAGVLVGAYPLAFILRRDPAPALRDGTRTVGGKGTRMLRGGFVTAQFALALPLLAAAGLLVNSFLRLQRVNPGFDPAPLLTANVGLPGARYANSSAVAGFWAQVLPQVLALPGVESAGLADVIPPDDNGSGNNNNFNLVDKPVPAGAAEPISPWPSVTREYFAALGIPLLEGRHFTPSDTGAAPVVLVSKAWAEKYYPDGSAVGKQLVSGGCYDCPRTTVIGVVGNVKYQGLDQNADAVYGPVYEGWSSGLLLFVKGRGNPADYAERVRAILRSVDPEAPIISMTPLEEQVYTSIAAPRHWASLIGGFGVVALVLAGIGTFGMLSYTVNARRREIGVRMALGATAKEVTGLIVRSGMGLAALGAGIGLTVAFLSTGRLSQSLFEVGATDPATLIGVTVLLLGAALLASWLPARRAARTDPLEVMRAE